MCLGDETEEIERSSDRIAEVSTLSQCPSGEAEVVDGVTTIQGEQGNLLTGRRRRSRWDPARGPSSPRHRPPTKARGLIDVLTFAEPPDADAHTCTHRRCGVSGGVGGGSREVSPYPDSKPPCTGFEPASWGLSAWLLSSEFQPLGRNVDRQAFANI